jgi:hypothetical protein
MVVFAKDRDSYGTTLFRFKGVFAYDDALSTPTRSVYQRKATRTTTVRPMLDRPYDPHEKFGGVFDPDFSRNVAQKLESGEWILQR